MTRHVGESCRQYLHVLLEGWKLGRDVSNGGHGIRSDPMVADGDAKEVDTPVAQTLVQVVFDRTDDKVPTSSTLPSPDGCDPTPMRSGGADDVPRSPSGDNAALPSSCVEIY